MTSKIIIYILCICLLFSCKKFVEVPPPDTQFQAELIFSNDQTANSAVNGLYSMLGVSNLFFLNGGVTVYTGLAADEIFNPIANSDLDPFRTNTIAPTHTNLFNRLWRPAYNNNCIYTANAILQGLQSSKSLTDSLRRQLIGEVKTIRAIAYYYLINMFGDVPLVVNTSFEESSSMPKTQVSVVVSQIINDLIDAEANLSTAYPTNNRGRVNRYVASALLARVYLLGGNWQKAEAKSSEVINAGIYTLSTNLNSVFTSTSSNEVLWRLVRDLSNTADGAVFIPSSTTTRPTYALTPQLLAAFTAGDQRKSAWTAKNTVSGVDYFYPYKYKSRLSTQSAEYLVIIRLAEMYLIRAEARANLNNLSGAQSDLNVIRNRAGLPNTAASTQSTLIAAIQSENQVEFFCEFGHRWIDLKRTNTIDQVLSVVKGSNWQTTDQLFPIPKSELDKNPFLTQNPGY